jgi:hypothetical protein
MSHKAKVPRNHVSLLLSDHDPRDPVSKTLVFESESGGAFFLIFAPGRYAGIDLAK